MAGLSHTSSLRRPIFISLALMGLYGTWIRSLANGSLETLFTALHKTHVLPSTDIPIRTRFTGIYWPIDYLLDVLVVFFWPAVDGSHPRLSAFGLWFAGQHTAVITTLFVQQYKRGRSQQQGWKTNATLWLMLFQLTGVAVTGPIYALINIGLPSMVNPFTTAAAASSSLHQLRVLAMSLVGGYLTLVVWMSLPSSGPRAIQTSDTQQLAVVAWNLFPLAMGLLQLVLGKAAAALSSSSSSSTGQVRGQNDAITLRGVSAGDAADTTTAVAQALRRIYASTLFLCILSHAGLLVVTASAKLFPMLFAASDDLQGVLGLPMSHARVASMSEGVLQFMQWDALTGFLGALAHGSVSYIRTLQRQEQKQGKMSDGDGVVTYARWAVKIGLLAAVAGPGSAIVLLQWIEDETLLAAARRGESDASRKAKK